MLKLCFLNHSFNEYYSPPPNLIFPAPFEGMIFASQSP